MKTRPKKADTAGRTTRVRSGRAVPALLTASVVLLLGLYAAALYALQPASQGSELPLDALVEAAESGDVASARFLDEDARITGTLADGDASFWTSYPRSDAATNDLLQTLIAGGTDVTVEAQTVKGAIRFVAQFLLPLVILANLFALLFMLARGGAGAAEFTLFGRLGDRRQRGGRGQRHFTFADVAAAEAEIAELAEVRDYLAAPAKFKEMGALPPKGILLVGPPGCGKTLLARALAGEAHASFYSISGSEFVESLVGVGAARVRDLFDQARASAPAIVFVDELDAVGRQRGTGLGGGHDEREQTLNELLVQMDGFSPSDGILVVAASNRPDILDPALLRAGRFDRRITVERPDTQGRLAILTLHARGRRLANPAEDLPHLARATPGFTGADLANVLNEAALLAVRWHAQAISRVHLDEAVERVQSGPRRTARLIPPKEKRRIAVHEAGHVVVAAAVGKADSVDSVSIVARGSGVGHLAVLAEDHAVLTRADMEARIAIAMAGIAAEEAILGEPSTGSEADLQRATDIARDMAGRYGMSERMGRVRVLREHGEVFLGRDYLAGLDVSQPTLEQLDAEVRRILDEQEATARAVLAANADAVQELSGALVTEETLKGPALERFVSAVRPHANDVKPRRAARRASSQTV